MKSSILSILVILTLSWFGRANAQGVPYDSVAVDSVISLGGLVDDPNFITNIPDGLEAHFHPDAALAVQFVVNGAPLLFEKGAKLHLYWRGQASAEDSNVAIIDLERVENYILYHHVAIDTLFESIGPQEMETILTVTDTGYNTIGIGTDADTGANSFWLDAVVLMQSGTASVGRTLDIEQIVLAGYPNPFLHSASTTLRVTSPESGQAVLSIRDMLGREVMQLPLGELDAGEQDIRIALDRAGVFFARLQVNGQWVGAPLKITAE
jgi:hypothetical protein